MGCGIGLLFVCHAVRDVFKQVWGFQELFAWLEWSQLPLFLSLIIGGDYRWGQGWTQPARTASRLWSWLWAFYGLVKLRGNSFKQSRRNFGLDVIEFRFWVGAGMGSNIFERADSVQLNHRGLSLFIFFKSLWLMLLQNLLFEDRVSSHFIAVDQGSVVFCFKNLSLYVFDSAACGLAACVVFDRRFVEVWL